MAIGGDPPPRALLGRALNGHSAEFCVLVTDFASFPIISSITPSFCLFGLSHFCMVMRVAGGAPSVTFLAHQR